MLGWVLGRRIDDWVGLEQDINDLLVVAIAARLQSRAALEEHLDPDADAVGARARTLT